jgi:hypothetical protein
MSSTYNDSCLWPSDASGGGNGGIRAEEGGVINLRLVLSQDAWAPRKLSVLVCGRVFSWLRKRSDKAQRSYLPLPFFSL